MTAMKLILLVLVVSFVDSINAQSQIPLPGECCHDHCPVGWTVGVTGNCYKYIKERETGDAAEQKCVEEGGHLVSLNSQSEEDWVFAHWQSEPLGPSGPNNVSPSNALWIGATKVSGTWKWTDGTLPNPSQTDWGYCLSSWGARFYQPDNTGNCAHLWTGSCTPRPSWNDLYCNRASYTTYYMCERPSVECCLPWQPIEWACNHASPSSSFPESTSTVSNTITTTAPMVRECSLDNCHDYCPVGWTLGVTDNWTGNCYKYIKERVNGDDAKQKCSEEGGHLVSLNSQSEEDWVFAHWQSQGLGPSGPNNVSPSNALWIGATKVSGTWKWTDGTLPDPPQTGWGYCLSSWGARFYQPDNTGNCAHLWTGSCTPRPSWNDLYCNSASYTTYYMCETPSVECCLPWRPSEWDCKHAENTSFPESTSTMSNTITTTAENPTDGSESTSTSFPESEFIMSNSTTTTDRQDKSSGLKRMGAAGIITFCLIIAILVVI
ncbi:macrophage mannose receptor 1-like [Amphiura filiformis]|uniref:macrophage mannose receptor 1-like n=1 Tax=Amphiura filiformis TaxID=82378 RepID=UPI003B2193E9